LHSYKNRGRFNSLKPFKSFKTSGAEGGTGNPEKGGSLNRERDLQTNVSGSTDETSERSERVEDPFKPIVMPAQCCL
jgi:hypothetical protein